MSQRNPMNQRYQDEDRKGVSRKSAASAKPKSKAAASVMTKSPKKTTKERKAMQKAARKEQQEKQRELDRKYYKPDTERYKFLRRLWWIMLALAGVSVAASWFLRDIDGTTAAIFLFCAYGFIIAAFYIDFSKIRKERQAYQVRMLARETEEKKKTEQEERRARQQEQRNSKRGSKHSNAKKNAVAGTKADPNKHEDADGSSDGKGDEDKAAEGDSGAKGGKGLKRFFKGDSK